jgi:hypothetical protein
MIPSVVNPEVAAENDNEVASDSAIGRLVVIGTVAATLTVFLFVAGGMWVVTGVVGESVILGAFCSVWGGPGFGVIVGGVVNSLQHERAARRD